MSKSASSSLSEQFRAASLIQRRRIAYAGFASLAWGSDVGMLISVTGWRSVEMRSLPESTWIHTPS